MMKRQQAHVHNQTPVYLDRTGSMVRHPELAGSFARAARSRGPPPRVSGIVPGPGGAVAGNSGHGEGRGAGALLGVVVVEDTISPPLAQPTGKRGGAGCKPGAVYQNALHLACAKQNAGILRVLLELDEGAAASMSALRAMNRRWSATMTMVESRILRRTGLGCYSDFTAENGHFMARRDFAV